MHVVSDRNLLLSASSSLTVVFALINDLRLNSKLEIRKHFDAIVQVCFLLGKINEYNSWCKLNMYVLQFMNRIGIGKCISLRIHMSIDVEEFFHNFITFIRWMSYYVRILASQQTESIS